MSEKQHLAELLTLLTRNRLEDDAVQKVLEVFQVAQHDPERYVRDYDDSAEWMLEYLPEDVPRFAVWRELLEFIALSDKVDELHEQIQDLSPVPLPDYPYDQLEYASDYFEWLDKLLVAHGYELISFGDSYGDDLSTLLVNRTDTARILELGHFFGFAAAKPPDKS